MAKVEFEIGGLTFLYEESKAPEGARRTDRPARVTHTEPITPDNKIAAAPENKLGTAEVKTEEVEAPAKRRRGRTRKNRD